MRVASCSVQEQHQNIINVLIEENPVRLDMTVPYSSEIIQLMVPVFRIKFFSVSKTLYHSEQFVNISSLFLCEFEVLLESGRELYRVFYTSRAFLRSSMLE